MTKNSTSGKLTRKKEYTDVATPFLFKLIFLSLTKTKFSILWPFGKFVHFSWMGLLGWMDLEMHHGMAPRPGQSCGIVPLLQFFLHSGTYIYIGIRRVNRGVNDNTFFKTIIWGGQKPGDSELQHVLWRNSHMDDLLLPDSPLHLHQSLTEIGKFLDPLCYSEICPN